MKTYVTKLIAARPTFMFDATADEMAVMRRHLAFWTEQMAAKRVVVFGPVADPTAPYGIAVLTLPDDVKPEEIMEKDPAIQANIGFRYEIAPFLRAFLPPA